MRALPAVALFLTLTVGIGCGGEPPPTDYVARVGGHYLTARDLADQGLDPGADPDSSSYTSRFVDRWIAGALLAEEARRRGLADDDRVQRVLDENARQVLASALVEQLYTVNNAEPGPDDVRIYFEDNQDVLRIREPYVRVRFLEASSDSDARAARRDLQRALRTRFADSLWQETVFEHALNRDLSTSLNERHHPESALFGDHPPARAVLEALALGVVSRIVEHEGRYFFLQIVDRVAEGSPARLEWVEDDIRRVLTLQNRKQIYARNVEQLRSAARSRNELEVR